MSRRKQPGGLKPAHHAAYEAMSTALLDLEHRGQQTTCHGRPEWVSDDPEDQAYAAEHCAGCPLADPCEQLGRFEQTGTYAGATITAQPSRRTA